MNTIQIIKETFPKANNKELIDLDKIAVIEGYENIKTPEKYLEKYLDNQNPRNEETYFKNGEYQCTGGRSRSFTDLYAMERKCMYLTAQQSIRLSLKVTRNIHQILIKNGF